MAAEKKGGRPLGATGEVVRENIRHTRNLRGVSGAELSARMTKLGRSIPPLGIQRIESGERRVDVDDLVAFAVALDVSPITLLMPAGQRESLVDATGLAEGVRAEQLWSWLTTRRPLDLHEGDLHGRDAMRLLAWWGTTRPDWAIEITGSQATVKVSDGND